jgi:glycosyltransferase involved in cell wall biosynthesis
MPVKNGMPFLVEAIDSIRRQTWKDWELLVVDDGSTDDTLNYLETLRDPRIRAIKNDGSGVVLARDRGVRCARGQLLAQMDADDVSADSRLEAQANFLMRNRDVVCVGAQVRFLVDGALGRAFHYPCDSSQINSALKSGRVALCNSALMIRADAARGIRPRIHGPGGDFDFCLRLASHGQLANLDQELLAVRVSRTSMSFSRVEEQLCGIAFSIACEKARADGEPEPDFAVFQREWKNRPLWHRTTTRLRAVHQRYFREAIIHRAHSNNLRALACLGASALLYPPTVYYRIKFAFSSLRQFPPQSRGTRCADQQSTR